MATGSARVRVVDVSINTGDRFTLATVKGLSVRYVAVYHRVPRPLVSKSRVSEWSGGCTTECILYKCLFTVMKVEQSPVVSQHASHAAHPGQLHLRDQSVL